MEQRKRIYGWKPDLPDVRDLVVDTAAFPIAYLPPIVDLEPEMPPVYDQGNLGSCTGNAISGAVQHLRMKESKANPHLVPSRLFIYWNERYMEGSVNNDAGAMIRDGIKSVATEGVCFEDLWPYEVSRFRDKPSPECYEAAKTCKALRYARLPQNLNSMKMCLAARFPIVMGFACYESFESAHVAKTGILEMPKDNEKMVGGHAILVAGYNQQTHQFKVRNSWGKTWGQNGYFWVPYQYFLNPGLADDLWHIRLV